jgi:hypothetical protein
LFRIQAYLKGCLKKRNCRICQQNHPTCLHIDGFQTKKERASNDEKEENSVSTDESDQPITSHACCTSRLEDNKVILQAILPVYVRQRSGKSAKTYAFYDHGSTGCFISQELIEDLEINGEKTTITIKTLHGVSSSDSLVVQDLVVSDIYGKNPVNLPRTYSRTEIPVSNHQIPRPNTLRQWPHLEDVANHVPDYDENLSIGLLIGSNCPLALEPLQVVPVEGNGPFAALYRHGWTINGPVQMDISLDSQKLTCNRVGIQEVEISKEVLNPINILKVLESDFAMCQVSQIPGQKGHSLEDDRFLQLAKDKIQTENGHYILPLPFRKDDPIMPNNKPSIEKNIVAKEKDVTRP